MKIEINYGGNQYSINVTNVSYDLIKHGTVTTEGSKTYGQPTETNLGYCTTMSAALNKLIRDSFADADEVLTIKEYVKRLENAVEDLKSYVDIKL